MRLSSWIKPSGVKQSLIKVVLSLSLMVCLLLGSAWSSPALAQSVQQSSPDLTASDIQAIAGLRQEAFAASQAGQFAAAEDLWSELLEYLPEEPALWSNRGTVRVSQNKLDGALADYSRAIELAPSEPDPYLNRGAALEGLGRWEDAIADYTQVLALNPSDAAAYNNRGNAKAGLGQWQAALKDYRQAVSLDPQFALARINEALALYQIGQTQDALRQFRGLSRKYPNFADARAALTAALWEAGQRGEAESNWVAVVGLDGRYKDLDWVSTVRRWPPAMVSALDKFLHL